MDFMNTSDGEAPSNVGTPPGYVTEVEFFQTMLAERNRRFDAQIEAASALTVSLFDSLKASTETLGASVDRRFEANENREQLRVAELDIRYQQRFVDSDLRYQQRFELQEAALASAAACASLREVAARESAEKAVSKSDAANEKRFDAVNEFRAQLRDQATTFIPRIETEQRLSQISARIDELRTNDDQRSGRSAGSAALYGWIVGGIAALATILVIANGLMR